MPRQILAEEGLRHRQGYRKPDAGQLRPVSWRGSFAAKEICYPPTAHVLRGAFIPRCYHRLNRRNRIPFQPIVHKNERLPLRPCSLAFLNQLPSSRSRFHILFFHSVWVAKTAYSLMRFEFCEVVTIL